LNDYVNSIKNKDIDGADDNAKTLKDINLTCDSLSITCSALCDAMTAYYIGISPWTGGASWAAVGLLVLTSAADATFSAFEIKNDILMVKSNKKLNQCRQEWDLIKSTFTDDQIAQICEWDKNLTDPKYYIAGKLAIYDDLMAMKDQIGNDKWNNFETTVAQIFGMNSDLLQQYEQFMNDPNTDPTYLAFGHSVMYSLFAGESIVAIVNSSYVLITLARLAENYAANIQPKITALNEKIWTAERITNETLNDVDQFNTDWPGWDRYAGDVRDDGNLVVETAEGAADDLKELNEMKATSIVNQQKANAAATSVAPEIIAFLTGFGIAATSVELLADRFLE